MSCSQTSVSRPCNFVSSASFQMKCLPCAPFLKPLCVNLSHRTFLTLRTNASAYPRVRPLLSPQRHLPVLKHKQNTTVCLFGGKDKSEGGNEISPWKAIEKAMGKKSLEDVLRDQMKKNEFYDPSSGESPPSGGNGGGGGGGGGSGSTGDGTDGLGDEGLGGVLEETLTVVLATLAFILLYLNIVTGKDFGKLAQDYIKYLFGGSKSIRLQRTMEYWQRIFAYFETVEVEEDEDWLAKEIVRTSTWYDGPEKYKRIVEACMEDSDSED